MLPLAAAVVGGCATGNNDTRGVTTRDSANVLIVENRTPKWETNRWTVLGTPDVQLGAAGRGGPYEFDQIRGVVRLSDGHLVVADGGSRQLRIFDAAGEHTASVGGRGGGPGEFEWVTAIGLIPDDTILVYDSQLRRFSYFDRQGSLIRTIPVSDDFTAPLVGLILQEDGRLVGMSIRGFGIDTPTGLTQRNYTLVVYQPVDSTLDTLGTWPGSPWFVRTSGRSVRVTQPLLAPDTYVAGSRDQIHVGVSATGEIQTLDVDGSVVRIVRVLRDARAVTDAIYSRLKQERLENSNNANIRRETRRVLDELERPDHVPYFQRIVEDRAGNLWARRYQLPDDTIATWDIIAESGRWLGAIELPETFWPLDIGNDLLTGVWIDELDVQQVWVLRIQRDPGVQ